MKGIVGRPTAFGLVQVVRVAWDKSSRGGAGAQARNAVPDSVPVSAEFLADARGLLRVQEVYWDETNGFAGPTRVWSGWAPTDEGYTFGCVRVVPRGDVLSARYEYRRSEGGAPDRRYFNWSTGSDQSPVREMAVEPGSWGRIVYNGRFSCVDSGIWWYTLVTVNVARLDGHPIGEIFHGKPIHDLRMTASLR